MENEVVKITAKVLHHQSRLSALRKVREMVEKRMKHYRECSNRAQFFDEREYFWKRVSGVEDVLHDIDAMIAEEEGR